MTISRQLQDELKKKGFAQAKLNLITYEDLFEYLNLNRIHVSIEYIYGGWWIYKVYLQNTLKAETDSKRDYRNARELGLIEGIKLLK